MVVFSDLQCDDNRRPFVNMCAFDGAPGTVLAGTLLPGWDGFAFTVEFEEDADDSRTGGKALLVASFVLVLAALIICLGRSGLFEENFES